MKMVMVFNYSNAMQLHTIVSCSLGMLSLLWHVLVSNDQLRGQTLSEQSQVFQWIEYADREILPVSNTLVYPCLGILQMNQRNNEQAKNELKNILQLLNNYLLTRTYLVGERITLADITVACDLLLLFQWVYRMEGLFDHLKDFRFRRSLSQILVMHIRICRDGF